MPPPVPQSQGPHNDPPDGSATETLFLLSISRDEDDAAALRADLRRSPLQAYKIQRCAELDDANHLLQVCGFDLAFLRLDDFQDRQAAVNLVRQSDPDLAVIALATGRLLASPDYRQPDGIDALCRIEDLSPSLVANLVDTVLARKRSLRERLHLSQELSFALQAGDLGSWALDTETGRVALCPKAADLLGLKQAAFLDDLLETMYPEDQDRLKRIVDLAIETQGDLRSNFRLQRAPKSESRLELFAKYRPGGPRAHPSLYGFIKAEARSSEDIQARIEAANTAIQKALSLRDEAIETASRELEFLMQKLSLIEQGAQTNRDLAAKRTAPEAAATVSTVSTEIPPQEAAPKPKPAKQAEAAPQPAAAPSSPPAEALGIDKDNALKNVLKSITRQKKEESPNTFPFDFSAEQAADYSEPAPQRDGFLGAANRLVSITRKAHSLDVTLSVDSDGAVEYEREKDLLFEILRELLTNVVKHARASECIIALFRDEDDWVLQVEDDGVGLENNLVSISTPLNKIGLFRIRTKLALKGGQLDLTPTFPNGLIARARLPVSLTSRGAERA